MNKKEKEYIKDNLWTKERLIEYCKNDTRYSKFHFETNLDFKALILSTIMELDIANNKIAAIKKYIKENMYESYCYVGTEEQLLSIIGSD